MTSPGHITRLPLELTQTIASFCPPDDIASLGCTCRHLHAICHHVFVLQASFLYHIGDPTSNHVPNKTALRNLLVGRLSAEDPTQAKAIWARLAAAASHLPLLIDELETRLLPYESIPWDNSFPRPGPVAPSVKNIIGTLSTLTVLGYPTVNDFAVTAPLTGVAARLLDPKFWKEWVPNPFSRDSLTAQLSFCLATGVLGNRVLNNMSLLSIRVASLFVPDSPGSHIFREWRQSFEGSQTTGLLIIACLPWMLQSDMTVLRRDDLPYPPALPLLNVIGRGGRIPLPDGVRSSPPEPPLVDVPPDTTTMRNARSISTFGLAPSWSNWLRNNVDVLIDDLSRGEWVGYYTNSFSREGGVDAPLRNIHFVTQPNPYYPDETVLTAEGCLDGVGRFRLQGTVFRPTGRVSLLKIYDGAHSWSNEGTLTPLGIAGCWGMNPQRPLGWLWMYKKEWAEKPVPGEVAELDAAVVGHAQA